MLTRPSIVRSLGNGVILSSFIQGYQRPDAVWDIFAIDATDLILTVLEAYG